MSLRDNELARRQDGKLELRPSPLRVRWRFDELLTGDGHELRAVFTCSARALPDPSERRMLEEVLLGSRYSLNDADVADHFEPALGAAAAKTSQSHTAAEWTGNNLSGEMIDVLRSAGRSVAFACGVELLPPFEIDIQSPTYQRQRLRARQQALAEEEAAGQIQHVQRATELLKQFHAMRDSAPQLSPGGVLQQISPADRGQVLQMLLLASARQGQAGRLWAVAGPYLAEINPTEPSARPQLHPLPPALGPLRSVQPAEIDGRPRLLIGARSGFMLVDPANPSEVQLFADRTESALGFNRVVYWGPRLGFAASHGEAGIVRWEPGQTEAPAAVLRLDRIGVGKAMVGTGSGNTQTAGPRNLQVLDEGTLIFSAGSRLLVSDLQDMQEIPSESASQIASIVPDERRMIVVHEDGTICSLDRGSRKLTCLTRRGSRVRSAGPLPWLGSTRLLLAAEEGAVDCVGLDDQLVTQYQSPHRGLRAVAGSANLVAGISGDRQRIILWQSWDGRKPFSEVYLTGLTRHRVADIDFG